ncbi:hypothetical protein BH24ACT5_BH24ACT5_18840 [soil metagenome]
MPTINDPTLGIDPLVAAQWSQRLGTDTRAASNQAPVRLNPSTWIAYPETARVVRGVLPDRVSRDDLRRMAGDVAWSNPSDVALESLFVHTMAWGSGTTNGRGPRYTNLALSTGAVPEVMAALGRHLSPDGAADVQRSRIAAAHALHRRLPGVGPAFFTKLLWVVALPTPPAQLRSPSTRGCGAALPSWAGTASKQPAGARTPVSATWHTCSHASCGPKRRDAAQRTSSSHSSGGHKDLCGHISVDFRSDRTGAAASRSAGEYVE